MGTGSPARLFAGDAALAATAALAGLAGVAAELRAAHPFPAPPAGAYAITVGAAALLLARRRWTRGVAVGTTALCVLYHVLGYPGLAVATPMMVACYLLVASGRSRAELLFGAVLMVVVASLPLLPPHVERINLAAVFAAEIGMTAVLTVADAARSRRLAAEEQLRRITFEARAEGERRLIEERLAIARELHDVLAHTVTLIGVQAAAGLDALDRETGGARPALTTIRAATREAMAELRSTVRALRDRAPADPVEPQPGLDQLTGLVETARSAGLEVTLDEDIAGAAVPAAVGLAVYRIVQEALTNVLRHAEAASVTVRLWRENAAVLVEVVDDGKGTAAGEVPDGGHGMIGMRERARAAGGSFEAGPVPAPGCGFAVRARLPLGE
ncbi:sensor histidine kinase [Amycolatopsis cynarae]|uniref:histidine kinase n=1 Tax=Amycolatopsis cynarae TaxID=2995223 RepID=A0ABY7AW08_9PSEU|nr:sensor histidine kinase [Amycolatopsis sp. HUAS 11-8]WAL63875.1 sensor histidine kinase [Amycolatopsis sp. HUAS 11-8]